MESAAQALIQQEVTSQSLQHRATHRNLGLTLGVDHQITQDMELYPPKTGKPLNDGTKIVVKRKT